MTNVQDYPSNYEDFKNLFRKTLSSLGYKTEKRIVYPFVDKNAKSFKSNQVTTVSIKEEEYE